MSTGMIVGIVVGVVVAVAAAVAFWWYMRNRGLAPEDHATFSDPLPVVESGFIFGESADAGGGWGDHLAWKKENPRD